LTETFAVIFLDPPYGDPAAEPTLMALDRLLAGGGIVVYEHASRYNPPERPARLRLTERRVYGDTAIALYALQEGE
jgi:16S rRNA G966 N2-methylase RsmD